MKFSFLFLLLALQGWVQTAEARWSVSTYNIRNFDAPATDMNELSRIIKDIQSDVMGFEEVKDQRDFQTLVRRVLPGYRYEISSCGGSGKQHLAVAYNTRTFEHISTREDLTFSGGGNFCSSLRPGLFVTLKHKKSGEHFTFGALHLKAGGSRAAFAQRWKQYQRLEAVAGEYSRGNLILLGDLNTTGYNVKNEDYRKFLDFLSDAKMRTSAEETACTSYWEGEDRNDNEYESSVLDHIVVQEKMIPYVTGVRVGTHCSRLSCKSATAGELGRTYEAVSDHCPVQVTFK